MSEIVPGFLTQLNVEDLVTAMAPIPVLLVSGEEDKYSRDTPAVIRKAIDAYRADDAEEALQGLHYPGGHELDQSRFEAIVEWIVSTSR